MIFTKVMWVVARPMCCLMSIKAKMFQVSRLLSYWAATSHFLSWKLDDRKKECPPFFVALLLIVVVLYFFFLVLLFFFRSSFSLLLAPSPKLLRSANKQEVKFSISSAKINTSETSKTDSLESLLNGVLFATHSKYSTESWTFKNVFKSNLTVFWLKRVWVFKFAHQRVLGRPPSSTECRMSFWRENCNLIDV